MEVVKAISSGLFLFLLIVCHGSREPHSPERAESNEVCAVFSNCTPTLCSHFFPLVLIFFAVLGSKISGEENVTAVEGDDAVLVCEVEGNPTPQVTWIAPNGTELQSGIGDTNLTLYGVTRGDSGTYVCNVRNEVGGIAVKRRLHVLCKCSLGSGSFIVFSCFPLMTRRGIQSFRYSCFFSWCRDLARFPPSTHC